MTYTMAPLNPSSTVGQWLVRHSIVCTADFLDDASVADLDTEGRLELLLVVGRLPEHNLEQLFSDVAQQYAGGQLELLRRLPRELLVDVKYDVIDEVLPGKVDEAKRYLADPIAWACSEANLSDRLRKVLGIPATVVQVLMDRLAEPLVGADLPADADDLTTVAWVWANYTLPAERLAPVMRALPSHLRAVVFRSTTGQRAQQMLAALQLMEI